LQQVIALREAVSRETAKKAPLFFSSNTFQLFFRRYFLAVLTSLLAWTMRLTAGQHRTKIVIVHAAVPAVAKTLLFTALVPGSVAGIVPWLIRRDSALAVRGAELGAAAVVIVLGVAIYLYTALWSFAAIGGGTPAPIAPTKILVVQGLHRFVRNPMYIGIGLVVGGQAWLFHSFPLAVYFTFFSVAVHLFVLFYEEPTLRKQFGEEYDRYRASVPRWIPKFN